MCFLCNSVIYSSSFSLSCSSQATKTKHCLDQSDMLLLFSHPVSLYMCNNSRNGANLSGSFIFTLLRFLHSPYYTTISPEYFQKFYKQKDRHIPYHIFLKIKNQSYLLYLLLFLKSIQNVFFTEMNVFLVRTHKNLFTMKY